MAEWDASLTERDRETSVDNRDQGGFGHIAEVQDEQPGSTSVDYRCGPFCLTLLSMGQRLQHFARVSERAAEGLRLESFEGFMAAEHPGACGRNYWTDDRLAPRPL